MKVIAIMNSAAGLGAHRSRQLQLAVGKAFADAQVGCEVLTPPALAVRAAAREAAGKDPDAVVAVGGDGTVSAVAGALVGRNLPLGILPTGTLNHFAKDLKLPLDIHAAARVIASGRTRQVDVGQVNNRYFINNSSIGLYPQLVWHRDQQLQRLVRGKWIAMAMALVPVFHRYPVLNINVLADDRPLSRNTPFVFVGNNLYDMRLLSLGGRLRLDGGVLGLYVANRSGRLALLQLMLRAAIGRLEQTQDFEILPAKYLRIDTRKHALRVALDGELHVLTPPLEYRILPRALKVIVP
jgi:diacylglycerol kinase family enzyme